MFQAVHIRSGEEENLAVQIAVNYNFLFDKIKLLENPDVELTNALIGGIKRNLLAINENLDHLVGMVKNAN